MLLQAQREDSVRRRGWKEKELECRCLLTSAEQTIVVQKHMRFQQITRLEAKTNELSLQIKQD